MSADSLFTPLLRRDASGREWLGALLRAAPGGEERFGAELLETPGSLSMSLSVRGISGRLGAFEYPLAPSPALIAWWIDHPETLVWPEDEEMSVETRLLRRALLLDEPPGSRRRAQSRARELLRSRSVLSQEWWRFEPLVHLECLLMTDRLVLTIATDQIDPLGPATRWYPARSRLVRNIEAAQGLAEERAWACLLLSETSVQRSHDILTDRALEAGAPHLGRAEQRQLRQAYLGSLTWDAAAAAMSG